MLVSIIHHFQLSYGASSPALSDNQMFPKFFRTLPSETQANSARIAVMDMYNWTKVATLHETEAIFTSVSRCGCGCVCECVCVCGVWGVCVCGGCGVCVVCVGCVSVCVGCVGCVWCVGCVSVCECVCVWCVGCVCV